jgi:MFS superfamily sulfate permease-like transporter
VVIYKVAFPRITPLGRLPNSSIYRSTKQYPEAEETPGVFVLRVDAPLLFFNIEGIKEFVSAAIKQGRAQGKQAGTPIRAVVVDLAPVTGEPTPPGSPPELAENRRLPAARSALRAGSPLAAGHPHTETLPPTAWPRFSCRRPLDKADLPAPSDLPPSPLPPRADVDATGIHFLDDLVDDLKKQGIRLVLGNPSTQVTP